MFTFENIKNKIIILLIHQEERNIPSQTANFEILTPTLAGFSRCKNNTGIFLREILIILDCKSTLCSYFDMNGYRRSSFMK